MKLYLTFKTPDVLREAAKEKADDVVEEQNQDNNLSPDDADELRHETFHKFMKLGRKFVRDGEYVTLELDTDAETCTVVPA